MRWHDQARAGVAQGPVGVRERAEAQVQVEAGHDHVDRSVVEEANRFDAGLFDLLGQVLGPQNQRPTGRRVQFGQHPGGGVGGADDVLWAGRNSQFAETPGDRLGPEVGVVGSEVDRISELAGAVDRGGGVLDQGAAAVDDPVKIEREDHGGFGSAAPRTSGPAQDRYWL